MKRDSGSESDASGAPASECAGARFRVRVCLARYFSDSRARAYVCVSPRRRVRWLRRRLRALFALPPAFELLSRGHLLPPDEPLAVLRRDDPVDVIPCRGEGDGDVAPRVGTSAPESGVGDSGGVTPAPPDRDFAASDVATPEPDGDVIDSGAAVERDDEFDLNERKRRALLMLHQYSECSGATGPEALAARPRRRRVRRRRRAAPSPRPPRSPHPPRSPRSPRPPGDETAEDEASVLHNSCERSRPPRVVRPLGDDAPL